MRYLLFPLLLLICLAACGSASAQKKQQKSDSTELLEFNYPCINHRVNVDVGEIGLTTENIFQGFDIPLIIKNVSKKPLNVPDGFVAWYDGGADKSHKLVLLQPGAKIIVVIHYIPCQGRYTELIEKRELFTVPINRPGWFRVQPEGLPYVEYNIQMGGRGKISYSERKLQSDSIELLQFNYPCINHHVNINLGVRTLSPADIEKGEVEIPLTIKNISATPLSVPKGFTLFASSYGGEQEASQKYIVLKPGKIITIPVRHFFSKAYYMQRVGTRTEISNDIQLERNFATGEEGPKPTIYRLSVSGTLKAAYDTNRKGMRTVVSTWKNSKKADITEPLQFNYPCFDNILYVDIGELELSISENYLRDFNIPIVFENVSHQQLTVPSAFYAYHDGRVNPSGPFIPLQPGNRLKTSIHYYPRIYPDTVGKTEVFYFSLDKHGWFKVQAKGKPATEYTIRLQGRGKVVY